MNTLPEFVKSGEPARLIPVVADTSREQRVASVILAAMRGVFEFRQIMLNSLGVRVGSRATLDAWTEVTFKDELKNGVARPKKDRPDGLLVLDTGRNRWMALVEAKIGHSEVDEQQLRDYLAEAKHHKIDAVITITNQFVAFPSHHPIKVPKSLTRGVDLYHWSWTYILTQATLILEGGDVESPDQQFLLEEVVRYLSHDSSGISRFDSMNREWKEVIGKVKSNATLNKTSEEVENTVSSWHQEQRDLCLVMSRKIGRIVKLNIPRSHRGDPQQRLRDDIETLVKKKTLTCGMDIPDAAATLHVTADLAKRTVVCSMRVGAPQDKKRASAKVNWLTRQLKGVDPTNIYVKAIRTGRAEDTQARLAEAIDNPDVLASNATDAPPQVFEVFYIVDLAGKFSSGKKFIGELEQAAPHFYEQAGQRLRAWVAPPPKIKSTEPNESAEPPAPEGEDGPATDAPHDDNEPPSVA